MSQPTRQSGVPFPRTERATQMHAQFDAGFAHPAARTENELEDVLTLRLGDERCVLRLGDLARMIAHPQLTPVPTSVPALIGVMSNRGTVVAAYDLCVLRGGPPTTPRWLVISATEPEVGLTFEHFDGYRRVARDRQDGSRLVKLSTVVETIRGLAAGRRSVLTHATPDGDRENQL